MSSPVNIIAFYQFHPFSKAEVVALQKHLIEKGNEWNIRGLIILAEEGLNGTVAGPAEGIEKFQKVLLEHAPELLFKNSKADTQPFKRWFVKIRPEIVTIKKDGRVPTDKTHKHLTPKEWQEVVENEDVVILDARNTYETAIGMFEGAIDPGIASFQEFPEYVSKANLPKDKKILMYCTGGIRCEKALLEMEEQGFENVYQLSGGILKYFEEFPETHFKGECFVFDHRVAVNQSLLPSNQYKLCPHCGDPGKETITCLRCNCEATVCERCVKLPAGKTCSKNCAYHFKRKGMTAIA